MNNLTTNLDKIKEIVETVYLLSSDDKTSKLYTAKNLVQQYLISQGLTLEEANSQVYLSFKRLGFH